MSDDLQRLWAPWRLEYIREAVEHQTDCFLCAALQADDDREWLIVHRGTDAFVIMNRYPYNNGHLLVVPNRHAAELDDLSLDEMTRLFDMVRQSLKWLAEVYRPDGCNIGINIGQVAGAGLPGHVHVHVVPRWSGDVNFLPVLGYTKVISEGLQAGWEQLHRAAQKD